MAEDATAEDATAVGAFGPIGSLAVSSAPNDASQEPWLVASSSAPLDPPEHVQTIRPTRSEAHSEATDVEKADAPLERTPPTVPILHPYYRWCRRCERVKPYRAHHCRHCGTCVLGMDHHCRASFSRLPLLVTRSLARIAAASCVNIVQLNTLTLAQHGSGIASAAATFVTVRHGSWSTP